jgi:phage gp46-like protein
MIAPTDEKLTSRMADLIQSKLTNATRQNAEQYARESLAWMSTSGMAKSVTATATIPAVGMMLLTVGIEQPDRILNFRYSINWQTMQARVL